jgi:MFS family permease
MVIARVRPSLYLCGLALVWGVVAAFMALTKNWQQLAGVRFVLGFVESGFAPGIAFYLSSWYVLDSQLLDLLQHGILLF